jgi:hypothetical protein
MTRLLILVATTIFGGIGWWLGERHGIMTAFILSMIGTGVGIYAGRLMADRLTG